jgi:hypothetical protein
MKRPITIRPSRAIPFEIPMDWTPRQALAVFKLLDDLSHRIWSHYQLCLVEEMMEQDRPFLGLPGRNRRRHAAATSPSPSPNDFPDDDIPF